VARTARLALIDRAERSLDLQYSTVTLLDEPQAGLGLRLQATVLSWLPIEPLL
jgi:hypothetical protein